MMTSVWNIPHSRFHSVLPVLLSLSLVSACVIPVHAEESVPKYTYHFSPHEITDADYTDEIAYTDQYFADSASVYNAHLATASMSLAAASISANTIRSSNLSIPYYDEGALHTAAASSNISEDYWYKSGNLQELLNELGFSNFEVNKNYVTQPGEQTIGVGVATKAITVNNADYTLIAIVPRSAGYEKEWAGNFTIGDGTASENFALGFYNARQEMIRFSADYIQRHGISGNVKIWTVGYSRGAAAANLTAGWYADNADTDSRLSQIALNRDDIYAYTFGTPAGVYYGDDQNLKTSYHTDYPFIYNLFADYDPVAMLALDQWGFTRYGTDLRLDEGYDTATHLDTQAERMKAYLKVLNPTVYDIYNSGSGDPDSFSAKKFSLAGGSLSIASDAPAGTKETFLSQEMFLKGRLQFLSDNLISSRSDYVKYEPVMQAFMVIYLGDYSSRPSDLVANFTSNNLSKSAVGSMYIYYIAHRYLSSLAGVDISSEEYQLKINQMIQAANMAKAYLNELTAEEKTGIDAQLKTYSNNQVDLNTVIAGLEQCDSYLNNALSLADLVAKLKEVSSYCLGASLMQSMEKAGYTSEEIQRLVGASDSNLKNMGYFIDLLSCLLLGSDGFSNSGEQFNLISIPEDGSNPTFNLESDQLRVLATFAGNGGSYMRVHNNEVILSWLKMQDSYFSISVPDSSASVSTDDGAVTCQEAGYPEGYEWNEEKKACQLGFLDMQGVFHSTAADGYIVPNTAVR